MIDRVVSFLRYANHVRAFLRNRITPEQAQAEIVYRLANRRQSFLRLVEQGIYARPQSLYAKLLRSAGVGLDDLNRLVEQTGVEGALARLFDAGVYVTSEELKGRQPLKRGGLELEVRPSDFANPFATGYLLNYGSSGSTGHASSASVALGSLHDESTATAAFLAAHGILERPSARLGVPMYTPLYHAKIGRPMEKFFAGPGLGGWRDEQFRSLLQLKLTVWAAQLAQRRLVNPEFSQQDQTVRTAEWLAGKKSGGTPALLVSFASPAVRVCLAATDRGLDISGTVMLMAGEPFTPGKAAVLRSVGCAAAVWYVANETGSIGFSCAKPSELDDVHLLTDRLAVVQRELELSHDESAGSLFATSLTTSARRLLLNAETGDYARMEQRECACLLGEMGLSTHLSGIRSYAKLTGEGVTFIGSRLHDLLEDVLPARFGGSGINYQLVEEEENGLPKVSILVSPSVGAIDEAALLAAVVEVLRGDNPVWTGIWLQEKTLRVVRREPFQTRTAKVLPLHTLKSAPD